LAGALVTVLPDLWCQDKGGEAQVLPAMGVCGWGGAWAGRMVCVCSEGCGKRLTATRHPTMPSKYGLMA
jgi:hypothetical protein